MLMASTMRFPDTDTCGVRITLTLIGILTVAAIGAVRRGDLPGCRVIRGDGYLIVMAAGSLFPATDGCGDRDNGTTGIAFRRSRIRRLHFILLGSHPRAWFRRRSLDNPAR